MQIHRLSRPQTIEVYALLGIAPFLALSVSDIEADRTVTRVYQTSAIDTETSKMRMRGMLTKLAQTPSIRVLDESHCDPLLRNFETPVPQWADRPSARADGDTVCAAGAPRTIAPRSVGVVRHLGQPVYSGGFALGKGYASHRGIVARSVDPTHLGSVMEVLGVAREAATGRIALRGIPIAAGAQGFLGEYTTPVLALGRDLGRVVDFARDIDYVFEKRLPFQWIHQTDERAYSGVPLQRSTAGLRLSLARGTVVLLVGAALALGLGVLVVLRFLRPARVLKENVPRPRRAESERIATDDPAGTGAVAAQPNGVEAVHLQPESEGTIVGAWIRDSEVPYRTVFEQAGIGIAILRSVDGRILDSNPALGQMLGYSAHELLRLSFDDLRADAVIGQEGKTRPVPAAASGPRWQEHRFRRKDGALIWGRLVVTHGHAESSGFEEFSIGTLEDLSELKRSEDGAQRLAESLSTTMEGIADGFFTLDQDWRFTYVNTETERLLDRTRADLLGKVLWEEYPKRPDDASYLAYREAMRTMRTVDFEDFCEPLGVWFEVRAYPSNQGLAVHFRDISGRKQDEQQLHSLSDRLLGAQEFERAALARELHDEFGQVLTTIKLQLQVLARRAPSSRLEDCVALVDDALRRVRSLSLDLRPSQIDAGGLAIALRTHISRQTLRNITFRSDLDVPVLTGQRATACFRIAQEAVTNALRHSEAGHIDVSLSRRGDFLQLVVRDDGEGFDLTRLRANPAAGTSLGIRGMEDRVSILGGDLQIRTGIGMGTEICATILLESILRSAA